MTTALPVGLMLLLDSRAPAGSHAHSGGMEIAVDTGLVADLDDVEAYCLGRLRTSGRVAAAFAAEATRLWQRAASADAWAHLDLELNARTPSPAARRASRQLGNGLLRLIRHSWPAADLDRAFAHCARPAPHHAVVLGAGCALADGSPLDAARAAALGTCTSPATAAVRLLSLDPHATHALLARLATEVETVADSAASLETLPATTAPALELLADVHASKEVRLLPPDHDYSHEHNHEHNQAPVVPQPVPTGRPFRVGIGGPVGSGKTALVAALCRTLGPDLSLAVVTNDIYTTEDAEFLRRAGVLPVERIRAVETGACPHTAIRDDITANLDAVELLEAEYDDLELILVESGGDNLTATFSYGLVDRQIFVIDVAGGDKVPRKGGPGITRSDLLVINKTDLAPLVGADLAVMDRDARAVRQDRPFVFTSLTEDSGAAVVADWIRRQRSALVNR